MYKMEKLVSVIMSVYNDEANIGNAITSILNQTYKNLELLILDDGSTDGSLTICQLYQKKDKRIKVFKNDVNLGLTNSLNTLIGESNGEYIARQDSDDVSIKYRIKKQIDFMNKYSLDASSSRAQIKDKNRMIPKYSHYLPIAFVLKYKNPIIHGTLIVKSEVFKKIGKYDESYIFSQDYELMTRLQMANLTMKICKDSLYILNMKENISSIQKGPQEKYAKKARQKYRKNL